MIEKLLDKQKIQKATWGDIGPNAIAINLTIDKVNELIEKVNSFNVVNPSVSTKKEPKVCKAIRRKEKIGEWRKNEGGFFEVIELTDENGDITISQPTHPESYFTFRHDGVEYLSLPNSNGERPVYHRIL